jgi:hypothetical protein
MAIDPDALLSLASEYARGMTSIRGRRVQRLLRREFAGADQVLQVPTGSGAMAVLGLSASGAAACATDGKGRQAAVLKWSHGSTVALETQFDLYKDSLPVLGSRTRSLASMRAQLRLQVPTGAVAPEARLWLAEALEALA